MGTPFVQDKDIETWATRGMTWGAECELRPRPQTARDLRRTDEGLPVGAPNRGHPGLNWKKGSGGWPHAYCVVVGAMTLTVR